MSETRGFEKSGVWAEKTVQFGRTVVRRQPDATFGCDEVAQLGAPLELRVDGTNGELWPIDGCAESFSILDGTPVVKGHIGEAWGACNDLDDHELQVVVQGTPSSKYRVTEMLLRRR